MKIFFLRVFIFICLLFWLINAISALFVEPKHFMNTINDFNRIVDENKEIDIAMYGSSHVYSSFDPRTIDSIVQARSFNFGSAAQRIAVTKYVVGESFKKIRPKVVVIDLYASSIKSPNDDESLSHQKQAYNFFAFSFDKLKSIIEVFPSKEVLEIAFPVFDRKDYRLNFDNIIFNKDYRYKTHELMWEYRGFAGLPFKMKQDKKFDSNLFVDFSKKGQAESGLTKFTKEEERNIKDLINKAKSQGANVLIVTAPFLPAMVDPKYAAFHRLIDSICIANNVGYIDFNFLGRELNLDFSDFRNAWHLNQFGAKKVSSYLGNYIKTNYDLPNRSKEKDWISEQPVNTLQYLSQTYEDQSLQVDEKLIDSINIVSFGCFDEGDMKTFIFKLNDDIETQVLEKYKLGLYLYAYDDDKNLLSDKGRNFESANFSPTVIQVNGNRYIVKKIRTTLTRFSKIRFFLFDTSGYKGIIGNAIEIENILAHQKSN
ncbi:hypothetical protein [Kriegella aquimaris]|uniref:hypothetical protein n=1 Tax=Kriegella aquimaris TaxID=192904 RepID=UPI000B7D6117|nr:hypothetical protein [Kriegella aquimaris]